MQAEIILPQAEPEWEWVRGRALQKVSLQTEHGVLQGALWAILDAWNGDAGIVGSEWRFRVAPPQGIRRPLVPDVAFLRIERYRALSRQDRPSPPLAPDIVVEILSPDDRDDDVADKIATYLAAGVPLLIVVDPAHRVLHAYDASASRTFERGETLTHARAPGLAIDVSSLFKRLDVLDS
jgi:Uma2 family endonuclease